MDKHQFNIGELCTTKPCEAGLGNKVAIRWISEQFERTDFTFTDLDRLSNRFSNVLRALKINEGDVVFTLLPKLPEVFFTFLGSLKAKCIIGTLFSNFGVNALLDRLGDSGARLLVTHSSLYPNIEKIRNRLPSLKWIVLVDASYHLSADVLSWKLLISDSSSEFRTPLTSPDTPSVLHYTSGSTGKPKGVLHCHGSIFHLAQTMSEVFGLGGGDIFWCTADQGWITGTSYGIIGPCCLGITQIHFAGPYNAMHWFRLLEDEGVSTWYTAPTALRMLMREAPAILRQFNLRQLRDIFSVGEPLNPEVISWSRDVLGKNIYDTWFQTETGAIMIANRQGLPIRPGSMGRPLSGIQAAVLSNDGSLLADGTKGNLCIKTGWSSMFISYINNETAYTGKFKDGWYYTGDMAWRDTDGYYWFLGRDDDVINTSGHLVSPFEIESALLELPEVAESGVIGAPDELLFEKVVAFVCFHPEYALTPEGVNKISKHVASRLSSVSLPQEIFPVDVLPKNKSGKIMRRVLRARYLGENAGDISTLEDGSGPTRMKSAVCCPADLAAKLFHKFPSLTPRIPIKKSLDSLGLVQLAVVLSEYGIELAPEECPETILDRLQGVSKEKGKVLSIVSLLDSGEERFITDQFLDELSKEMGLNIHFEHMVLPRVELLLQDLIFYDNCMPLGRMKDYEPLGFYLQKIKNADVIIVGGFTEFLAPESNDYPALDHSFHHDTNSDYLALRWGGYFQNHHKLKIRIHCSSSFRHDEVNNSLINLANYLKVKIFRVCFQDRFSAYTKDWEVSYGLSDEICFRHFTGVWSQFESFDFFEVQQALRNFILSSKAEFHYSIGESVNKFLRSGTNHYCGWLVDERIVKDALKACSGFHRIGYGGPQCSIPALQVLLRQQGHEVIYLKDGVRDDYDFFLQTGFGEEMKENRPGYLVMDHPFARFSRYARSAGRVPASQLKEFLDSDLTSLDLSEADKLLCYQPQRELRIIVRYSIRAGTSITHELLDFAPLETGLSYRYLELLIGRKLNSGVCCGEPLLLKHFLSSDMEHP